MLRVSIAVLVFLAASLCFLATAEAQFCQCTVTATSPEGVFFACPQGDGDQLQDVGLTVSVTLVGCDGYSAAGVPTSDIWLETCVGPLTPCGEGGKIYASVPTDANGQTTITGGFLAVGGCDNNVRVVVFHRVGFGGFICETLCTVPIKVRSADINSDLVVDLIDFATFGAGYQSPPRPYNACIDYRAPFGTVTLSDFAKYGEHSGHGC